MNKFEFRTCDRRVSFANALADFDSEEYINRCFGELAIELKTKPTPWLLLLLLQPFFLSTGEISPESEIKNFEKKKVNLEVFSRQK
jgi:hypothetical protein